MLVGAAVPGGTAFAIALVVLGGFAVVGFVVALLLPRPAEPVRGEQPASAQT